MTQSTTESAAAPVPAMLAAWTSWMDQTSAVWQRALASDAPQDPTHGHHAAQLTASLAHDPMLRSIDQMWNANPLREVIPVDWSGIAWALRTLWLRSLRDPKEAARRLTELNTRLWNSALDAWTAAGRNWWGLAQPSTTTPPTDDKRFAAPEWSANPAFRTLRDLYLLASDALLQQAGGEGEDPAEQHKLIFHLRQFVDATSPTLLLMSNPAALKRAMETGGASLADGARNLLRDLKDGKLTMVDETAFAPGKNLAMTPGKVVHRNALIELIQYAPTTAQVHPTPLLILPPWINKFYIMDMQPKNSMVKFLVGQGFTVFMVSWKNPDSAMEDISIEDYMDMGPLAASHVAREITSSPTVNVMGYCIGGTLLTMTLAHLAAMGETDRFNSASFMVSLQDFARVGDTAIFMGESTVDFIEQQMLERGYLDSREMSNMFNLLRSNDLIWSNVVNNYLLGQKPAAFDLLYWNSDGTRMARNAHSWYLRNTYAENNLVVPGKIELRGTRLDMANIKLDTYAVGAEKDHIVPWDAAWRITQLFGGTVRYVLASSGHIAGIINPPGGKGNHWVGDHHAETAAEWRAAATKHDGSWWNDWAAWLAERSGVMAAPPPLGTPAHPALMDAPGSYVLAR